MDLLRELVATLPVIIMITFIEVLISFSVAALAMLELMPGLGREHPLVVLVLSIVIAIATQTWIMINHKVRAYVTARSRDE